MLFQIINLEMKILIAGDYCPQNRVASAFECSDYYSVLSEVREIVCEADYSIVNLECPVVESDAKPIVKQGPSLKCSSSGIDALKYAGINCVTLANNHFLDFGEIGAQETISTLNSRGIDYVGGGMNLEQASKILYKDINGHTLAIINCCEHEFSIATESSSGSNPLNPIRQYYAITEAKTNADRVLVITHGGHEHFQLPSPRMVETYRFFIDAGADAVINHHQHCYSGYEVYHGKPIFYGLGNFCFDNPEFYHGFWTEGYAVLLDFSYDNPSYILCPYRQCTDIPTISFLPRNAFKKEINQLNSIIGTPSLLKDAIEKYYSEYTIQYSSIFEPFYNHYYKLARYKGWIPSLVGKCRKLAAQNYVCCEAHRDKLMWWLNK